jgi:hypothetical protein
MTIAIRNYVDGEAIRTWNQPGKNEDVIAKAMEYAVGMHYVSVGTDIVEVWVMPE